MPGRHQLVKSTLTFTATHINTVLLIFATAHKKTIKNWKHCSCINSKSARLNFTNPQKCSEKLFFDDTARKSKPAIWQLVKSTLKKSTFQFATAIKTNENIWEHCSCTVYKNLWHKKKYGHTEADSERVFSTSRRANSKLMAGNNS